MLKSSQHLFREIWDSQGENKEVTNGKVLHCLPKAKLETEENTLADDGPDHDVEGDTLAGIEHTLEQEAQSISMCMDV